MSRDNEGPQQITIPQQSFTTCSGCKYFSRKLVRSGRDPVYRCDCTHPDNGQDKAFKLSFTGNLIENDIGVVVTPEWCPFLKPKENEEAKTTS